MQVSFVNSINTIKGGTHANYIADAVGGCALRGCVASAPALRLSQRPAAPAASCWSAS
jgi:hypothetical protein